MFEYKTDHTTGQQLCIIIIIILFLSLLFIYLFIFTSSFYRGVKQDKSSGNWLACVA